MPTARGRSARSAAPLPRPPALSSTFSFPIRGSRCAAARRSSTTGGNLRTGPGLSAARPSPPTPAEGRASTGSSAATAFMMMPAEIGEEIFDYRRQLADGTWLERRKTVTPDPGGGPGVNRIIRRYSFYDDAGRHLRELVTESRQRSYRPDELVAVLRQAGFRIVSVTEDFTGLPPMPGARTLVVEAASL